MQISVRSYLTAGVAFVGAGAIALTPVAPPMPTIDVHAAVARSANIALMASPNPIEAWVEVLEASVGNIGTLGQAVLANPAPIVGQVAHNQLANATDWSKLCSKPATPYWNHSWPSPRRSEPG